MRPGDLSYSFSLCLALCPCPMADVQHLLNLLAGLVLRQQPARRPPRCFDYRFAFPRDRSYVYAHAYMSMSMSMSMSVAMMGSVAGLCGTSSQAPCPGLGPTEERAVLLSRVPCACS